MHESVKNLKLHTKFVILLVGLSMVPLVIVSVLTLTGFQASLQEEASRLGNQLGATVAAEAKSVIISQLAALDNIAVLYDPEFPIEPESADRILENLLFDSKNFIDLSIVNADGVEIARKHRLLVFAPDDLRSRADSGAFYALPKFQNSGQAVADLYEKHHVITYDSAWFGAPRRLRSSYALDASKIQEGLQRLKEYRASSST